jgi:hypothetical protein
MMAEVVVVAIMMMASWAAPRGACKQRGAQHKGGKFPGSLGRHLKQNLDDVFDSHTQGIG